MKLSTFFGFVLLASVVLIAFSIMVEDLETNYIDTGIVDVAPMNETYRANYNQTAEISSEFSDLEAGFNDLATQDSWWEGIGDMIGAIPLVIISFPAAVIGVIYNTITNMGTILTEMGIPKEIIYIAGLGLIVWLIIKLINFWQAKEPV